jgi:outer membrane immunogenic protein
MRTVRVMRTVFFSVTTLLLASTAYAADLQPAPLKAAPFTPVVPLWTGWYIGFQVGYGASPDALTPGALQPGFSPIFTSNALAGMPQGVTAGGRIGYDWQVGNVVWGLESDFNWANFVRNGNETLFVDGGTGGVSWQEQVNWWGSTNLRFGIPLAASQALLYALGGVAYGNRTVNASGFVDQFSTSGSFGGTGIGFDAGAGLAVKVTPVSEFFIEGRWIDLGSVSGQLSLSTPAANFVAPASQRFDFAVGQVGYAYHF